MERRFILALDQGTTSSRAILFDRAGNRLQPGTDEANEEAVREVRRTTLAARLKAIFGSVNRVDAFTGMLSERHLQGSELGELQNATLVFVVDVLAATGPTASSPSMTASPSAAPSSAPTS